MRIRTIYECDVCGKTSESEEEIQKCEAAHLGLTIDQVNNWADLIRDHFCASLLMADYKAQNALPELQEGAREKKEIARIKLKEFEAEHDLKGKEFPENWENL